MQDNARANALWRDKPARRGCLRKSRLEFYAEQMHITGTICLGNKLFVAQCDRRIQPSGFVGRQQAA